MTLNEYFQNPKRFNNKIIVIAAKDEASKNIKEFVCGAKFHLKLNLKYRNSYVAVIDPKRDFLYEEASASKIECSYKVDDKYIDIVSAGFSCGNVSSIKVGDNEYSINKTGLNIAIFDYKKLKLIDSFNCDTFSNEELLLVK